MTRIVSHLKQSQVESFQFVSATTTMLFLSDLNYL
jgi:hypothetical protein